LVNKNIRYTIIQTSLLLLILAAITSVAKSRPIPEQAQAIVFKRAESLTMVSAFHRSDNLEWRFAGLKRLKKSDFLLLKNWVLEASGCPWFLLL